MPEPDFDQIARVSVMTFYNTTPRHTADEQEAVARIANDLRLVWNARGAADRAILADSPYVTSLDTMLRTLDC